jgi:hypothetical protein
VNSVLAVLAERYRLDLSYLREWGLGQIYYSGEPVVRVPYLDEYGRLLATCYLNPSGVPWREWKRGDRPQLHGLQHLAGIRRAGWVVLVGREPPAWTLHWHRVPTLGLPGWASWRPEWAKPLAGLEVYLLPEADDAELPAQLLADLPHARWMPAQPDVPGPLAEHLAGTDLRARVAELKLLARPIAAPTWVKAEAAPAIWQDQAQPFLEGADVLAALARSLRAQGYGGNLRPALLLYLAMTTRLLALRPGATPVHICVIGPASVGKSYLVRVVRNLFPEVSLVLIDAGSPAAIIYTPCDLRRKVLIVGELDSLPTDEDDPLASAIRNLLQDGVLRYSRPDRTAEGTLMTQVVEREGPTVMITTATCRPPSQLETRFLLLWLDDSGTQLQASLAAQAQLEVGGLEEPDPALIAYQGYLEARGPWEVVVPYAPALAYVLGRPGAHPRLRRDFARLLALIKAVALLRHAQRTVAPDGRLVAELVDYAAVVALLGPLYSDSADGVAARERETVEAVRRLLAVKGAGETANASEVAAQLGVSLPAATHRIRCAVDGHWLINDETRRSCAYRLRLGEPLPVRSGLPDPAALLEVDVCQPVGWQEYEVFW